MKKKGPTIRDVAKEANVSVATVSRYLNKKGYMSDDIKQRVNKAIEKLNYIPNQVARSFYTNKTNLIGLIVPTICNPYFAEVAYYVEKAAEKRGYKLLLCNSLNDIEIEKNYMKMLLANQVDGIIIGTHNDELIDFDSVETPIIGLERFLGKRTIPTVSCDNIGGTSQALEYLYNMGNRKIICVSGTPSSKFPADDRKKFYSKFMSEHNLNSQFVYVTTSFDVLDSRATIKKELARIKSFDAIFATDDLLAINSLQVLDELGLTQKVSVVGFDGTDLITSIYPNLVTIKQPIKEMADLSVELLDKLVDGETVPTFSVLPITFIK